MESNENLRSDMLKHLHLVTREEFWNLREWQNKVFLWSSYIFLFIIGALAIIDQSKVPVWSNQGATGRIVASITVLVILMFSLGWQQRTKNTEEDVAATLNKIESLLHCYDNGYFGLADDVMLFPERWAGLINYHKRVRFWKRLFRINYISATTLLGFLAVIMIWL